VVRFPVEASDRCLLQSVQTNIGAHPASFAINVREFTEVKQPWREAVHPPPNNAEVKNEWRYLSTPRHTPSQSAQGHIYQIYLTFAWPCIIDTNNIDSQLDATITVY